MNRREFNNLAAVAAATGVLGVGDIPGPPVYPDDWMVGREYSAGTVACDPPKPFDLDEMSEKLAEFQRKYPVPNAYVLDHWFSPCLVPGRFYTITNR